MAKYIFISILLFISNFTLWADSDISFTASAPDVVTVNDQFRLSYTISTQEISDFRASSIKGFEILMGPTRSTQSSVQIVNGKTTSTSSVTFTYILKANSEGIYSIPGATISVKGKQFVSNSVDIKVLPAEQHETLNSNSNQSTGGINKEIISNDDLFILATTNKAKVYEQEAVLLTYKIYSKVDLRSFDNVKLPDFKGFHSQEIELPSEKRWGLEHYKGKNYHTTIYRQFVLFPQQVGDLIIESARFDASIMKQTQAIDPFEAFFNGGNYVEIKKTILTPRLKIKVQDLPEGKPIDFSGGVGEFNLSSTISSSDVKVNDAVTIKLVISGTGNLKLIEEPKIDFPEDFEIYDPKVDNKFRLTNMGVSGNKVIEYLAIPRNSGTYKIPAISFSFFDLKTQTYKNLTTEEYILKVEKSLENSTTVMTNYVGKEDLQILNKDIRYINLNNDIRISQKGDLLWGSLSYWLLHLIPGAIFIIVFIIYRKQITANANIVNVRIKKANKVAVKRMKLAGKLLKNNDKDAFYDEVLKALWGYVSDKLNIPISQLSKENVEEKLCKSSVEDSLVKEFLFTLDDCEFARFAPTDEKGAMDKIYLASLELIEKMENSIKH